MVNNNREAKLPDVKILQFLAPIAWSVVGLLAWSLSRQVDSFEFKVGRLTETQQIIREAVAEIRANTSGGTAALAEIRAEQRRRAEQVARLDALVTELVSDRRDTRGMASHFKSDKGND